MKYKNSRSEYQLQIRHTATTVKKNIAQLNDKIQTER